MATAPHITPLASDRRIASMWLPITAALDMLKVSGAAARQATRLRWERAGIVEGGMVDLSRADPEQLERTAPATTATSTATTARPAARSPGTPRRRPQLTAAARAAEVQERYEAARGWPPEPLTPEQQERRWRDYWLERRMEGLRDR